MEATHPDFVLTSSNSESQIVHSPNILQNSGTFLKLPNLEDIKDFVIQIQDAMQVSSTGLSDKTTETGHLSTQHHTPVNQLSGYELCRVATTLLRDFSHLSRSLVHLLNRSLDHECYSTVKGYANLKDCVRTLRLDVEATSASILCVQKQCEDFVPQMAKHQLPGGVKDLQVFERLDAFWKVIATQLLSKLDNDTVLPAAEIIRNAIHEWEDYRKYLESAMDELDDCLDGLKITQPKDLSGRGLSEASLARRIKKGLLKALITLWNRLTGRSDSLVLLETGRPA